MLRLLLIFFLLINTTFLIIDAQAATIIVNRIDDPFSNATSGCSLRQAVAAANDNTSIADCNSGDVSGIDLIILSVSEPIQLQESIFISSSLLVTTTLSSDPVRILAGSNNRIFEVEPASSNATVEFINLHFLNGDASFGGAILFDGTFNSFSYIGLSGCIFENNMATSGGAINFLRTQAENLNISNTEFRGNQASNFGGAIMGNQMIRIGTGTMELSNSLFEDNSAISNGGAVYFSNRDSQDIILSGNRFYSNSAGSSAGAAFLKLRIENGGVLNPEQEYDLQNNVFLYNQAGNLGGALESNNLAVVRIQNSTIAFNSANRGGGLVSTEDGIFGLSHVTIVHNSGDTEGDNIYRQQSLNSVPNIFQSFTSSIIAYPINGDNCAGQETIGSPAADGFKNIIDDQSCEFMNPSEIYADPKLSGLYSNGNDFPGFVPSQDSVAVDEAENSCNDIVEGGSLDFDQQGTSRPLDGDGNGAAVCDTGAIESPIDTDLIWLDSFGI